MRIAGMTSSKGATSTRADREKKKSFTAEVARFSRKTVERVLSDVTDYEEVPVQTVEGSRKRKSAPEPGRKRKWLMGFTLIPKNIVEHGIAFSPNDTFDCSTARSGERHIEPCVVAIIETVRCNICDHSNCEV